MNDWLRKFSFGVLLGVGSLTGFWWLVKLFEWVSRAYGMPGVLAVFIVAGSAAFATLS